MDLEKNPHNDGNSIDPLLVKKKRFQGERRIRFKASLALIAALLEK